MSICDLNKIDGLAVTNDRKGLAFFLADHLDWESEDIHLEILQDKINLYIDYFEGKKYRNIDKYREQDFEYAIIDIFFKYELTKNAEEFISLINKKIEKYNMYINYRVSE